MDKHDFLVIYLNDFKLQWFPCKTKQDALPETKKSKNSTKEEIRTIKFTVESYQLTKEVGDGFDNFEATANQYLFPMKIMFDESFSAEDKSLRVEIDVNTKIYADVDASSAFSNQEGIKSFFQSTDIASKIPLGVVFIFPIEGIETETAIIEILEGESVIFKKNIEIMK